MMETMIINQQNKIDFTREMQQLIKKVVNTVENLENLPENTEVSIVIVDNSYMQELNHIYRGQNCPTDVLSFAMNELGEDEPDFDYDEGINLLGDIIVSLEQAMVQCEEYGHSLERELGYLVTHGMLHLIGYDHETEDEQKTMRQLEERVMNLVKLER